MAVAAIDADGFAGDDRGALHDADRHAVTAAGVGQDLAADRGDALGDVGRVGGRVDQLEFEARGLAEQIDGPCGLTFGEDPDGGRDRELRARFRWRLDAVPEKASEPLLSLEVTSQEMEKKGWPIQTVNVTSKSAPVASQYSARARACRSPISESLS